MSALSFQHHGARTAQNASVYILGTRSQELRRLPLGQVTRRDGVHSFESRWCGFSQTTETSVAATKNSYPNQAAFSLGHRTVLMSQQNSGEAASWPQKAANVMANLVETVIPINLLVYVNV